MEHPPLNLIKQNQRKLRRFSYRHVIRFVPQNNKAAKLATAVSQNASSTGLQVLMSTIVDQNENLEIYIPILNQVVVPARAKVIWSQVEHDLTDSPYWIRSGLQLEFASPEHRDLFSQVLLKQKGPLDPDDTVA